jgi:ferredoxin
MAEKELKWEENVEGKHYVDKNCIAAKYCVAVAPEVFRMVENGSHAYVHKQPENSEEEEQAQDAIMGCPVSAIGDDG